MSRSFPTLPYRFYEFWVPSHGKFKPKNENDEDIWPTIIGSFIRLIVEDEPNLIYWFVQEGKWFQFCFASEEPERVAKKIRSIQKTLKIRTKRILKGDTSGALGGDRWLSPERVNQKEFSDERSELMLRVCHAACALYVHSLEKKGNRWIVEKNACNQNKHGNHFESLMHLIANLSQARFDIKLAVRTPWMQDYQMLETICHL